ncbi:acyl-CoA thioesterase [Haladaptatus sp. NG-SE-30]
MPYESKWTIYAGDTDYSGRIYTPVVIDYVIRTLGEYRSSVGFPNSRFEHGPVIPPARNIEIDYLGAITVDDELKITLTPTVGTSSVTHEFTGSVDTDIVFEGTLTVVYVDSETEEPVPVPDELVAEHNKIAAEDKKD